MENLPIVYPKNISKYRGTIHSKTLKYGDIAYRLRIKTNGVIFNKDCKTRQEAEDLKCAKTIEFGLPITNLCYDAGEYYYMALAGGFFCKIDADDFDLVDSYTWHMSSYGYVCSNDDGATIRMHMLLLQRDRDPLPGETVDHINRDSLDNRMENLRYASKQTQSINRKVSSMNTSGCVGVYFHNATSAWHASWRDEQGRTRHKSFSIKRRGNDQAKELAIQHRREMEQTLPHYIIALAQ